MNKGDFIISSGLGSSSNLKDYYEQYEIYQLIASGTTGTIEVPKIGGGTIDASKYSIKMDGYSGGLDALCLKTSGGKPIDDLAQTSSGSYITTSLSGEYNRTYNLSDTPSVYPVALSFLITMSLEDAKYLNFDYVLSREIDTSGFEFISNKKTTLAENSDSFYPTQKAVKTAVDGKVSKVTSVDKRIATFSGIDGTIQDDSLLKVSQGVIYPTTDGTAAIKITKANGTTIVINIDTTNNTVTVNNIETNGYISGGSRIQSPLIHGLANAAFTIISKTANYPIIFGNGGGGTTLSTEWARLTGNGDFNQPSSKYHYMAASPTADTVNDVRFYNNSGTLTFQKCTVANASKGGGTWVNIGTM